MEGEFYGSFLVWWVDKMPEADERLNLESTPLYLYQRVILLSSFFIAFSLLLPCLLLLSLRTNSNGSCRSAS